MTAIIKIQRNTTIRFSLNKQPRRPFLITHTAAAAAVRLLLLTAAANEPLLLCSCCCAAAALLLLLCCWCCCTAACAVLLRHQQHENVVLLLLLHTAAVNWSRETRRLAMASCGVPSFKDIVYSSRQICMLRRGLEQQQRQQHSSRDTNE